MSRRAIPSWANAERPARGAAGVNDGTADTAAAPSHFRVGLRFTRRPPAASVRDWPLRRREPHAGCLVDSARRPARGDESRRRADLATRRALRPARGRVRAALVAVARPVPASRRSGRRRRARRRTCLPPSRSTPRSTRRLVFALVYLLYPATQWSCSTTFTRGAGDPLLLFAFYTSTRATAPVRIGGGPRLSDQDHVD